MNKIESLAYFPIIKKLWFLIFLFLFFSFKQPMLILLVALLCWEWRLNPRLHSLTPPAQTNLVSVPSFVLLICSFVVYVVKCYTHDSLQIFNS